jgi:methylmalonyl-CoA mutase
MRTAGAEPLPLHKPPQWVRVVTAASLFDGHDVSINIMRRLLQSLGAEVIHLGHDRSVEEIADTAVQKDTHAIAISSYQGGHVEFFKYLVDRLHTKGAGHTRVYGAAPSCPMRFLSCRPMASPVSSVPRTVAELGLEGMIRIIIDECDRQTIERLGNEVEQLSTATPTSAAGTDGMARDGSALSGRNPVVPGSRQQPAYQCL